MELTLQEPRAALPARPLLHLMALAREGDRREGILLRQNKGWFQVSGMGHEALAAIVYAMNADDYLFPYYRDRAMVLARGVSNYELALAYHAKGESSSGGRQMPGHFSDRVRNIFSGSTPTASQCLPATGAAWAFKMAESGQVSVTSVGDASIRQGEFYEALAFALQEKLPCIFVIEDNHYGISTPTERYHPYRLGALGEKGLVHVDAHDPYGVYDAAAEAIAKARSGEGPTVLWCEIDRLCSHTSSDDQRLYRPAEEIAADLQRDPIQTFARRLIAEGALTQEDWDAEQEEIVQKVDQDYRRAEAAPDPDPTAVTTHLFGPPAPTSPPPVEFKEPTTMVAAVNQTLRRALEENERVVVFGEDIEDPKGGVFGLTKGLSGQFAGRVRNSPLAEATILGTAVGLASVGWTPIFEIQFTDFLTPALNQLMSQAASLRWRSCGAWACPMVIIAPYGAYLPGGSLWHSESNEGMWAHIHGINVVIPSTSSDAAGLLWTAIHGSNPTLFLLPKHIFRKRNSLSPSPGRGEVQGGAVPLGKAAIRREGSDVSLVTWGNCTELAEEAADRMADESVSVEIVDLRSIVPCDYETVAKSLEKTGRLVVVHEDARTTGFGQSVITEMTSNSKYWNYFLSPPQLVARKDVHIPYNPKLEYAVLPDIDEVLSAIRVTME
jgi:2-oxoisovalerate dehydrogenase E1 component